MGGVVMLMQIANGYIHAKGHAINNFEQTLPPLQSDLAKYIFKDPYNFSFWVQWHSKMSLTLCLVLEKVDTV